MRLQNGVNLLLETKGYAPEQTRAKHAGAKRWVSAVNNWNREKLGEPEQRGPWGFFECKDPQQLRHQLTAILDGRITLVS